MDNPKPLQKQPQVSNSKLYAFAFKTFGDFGITIAIPAVAAALLGKWLDEKYGTEPRYLILLLILAFALTAFIVYRKVKSYGREYQELFKEKTD